MRTVSYDEVRVYLKALERPGQGPVSTIGYKTRKDLPDVVALRVYEFSYPGMTALIKKQFKDVENIEILSFSEVPKAY